jgi:hypothetical protein
LKFSDCVAELPARSAVSQRFVERTLGQADGRCADSAAQKIESREGKLQSVTFGAE